MYETMFKPAKIGRKRLIIANIDLFYKTNFRCKKAVGFLLLAIRGWRGIFLTEARQEGAEEAVASAK